ncbi:MAG: HEAT repeat domain-containing protein [Anaerolineaceae bacterium]|nr:HEAT repeat domain-containing protein [Anaerolineaceae bacterium]
MGFDVENFGLGLLTGWVTAYGVYRARHRISSVMRATRRGATSAQDYAKQSADSRYVNDLVNYAETQHLAGRWVNLSRILIEPRFIVAPPFVAPPDDEAEMDAYSVVPITPDYPALYAPYNIHTLTLDELGTGSHALAILGNPGSGRTTTLLAIALKSLGRLHLPPPPDKVQERLDAEERALSDKQRADQLEERRTVEQRARERFAKEQGITFDVDEDTGIPLLNRLMPVYLDLADLVIDVAVTGTELDPAEPLVQAVQRQVGRITASTIPRNLYKRLNSGGLLLLLDGYDDLPESERRPRLTWLQELMRQYPDNFYIVAGPLNGYGLLSRLCLTPVYLRAWDDADRALAVDRWAAAWPEIAGSRRERAPEPDAEVVARARINNRALSPFDMTLKIWANFAEDTQLSGVEGWLRAYVSRMLPDDQPLADTLSQLTQAAALQLDEGAITRARLEALMTGVSVSDVVAAAESESADEAESDDDKKEAVSAQGKFLAALRRAGLLKRSAGGRYRFRHGHLTAYLASLAMGQFDERALLTKAEHPAWHQAVAYAALHTDIEPVVRARLNAPPDIRRDHVLAIAYWLHYAPGSVSWRVAYLKHLALLFANPSQYGLVRERVAAALIQTRDQSVGQVFLKAMSHDDAGIRQLACIAVGAVGTPEALKGLEKLLMNDPDVYVQIAGALGLGALGTEEALVALVEAFATVEEHLRQAIAEVFAGIPDEGYPILYDAIHDEDMLLRRAAVFGIRRLRSPWAVTTIHRAYLEDAQFIVRSAAQVAFQERQDSSSKGPHPYPMVESISWLRRWVSERGEMLPAGEGANLVLLRALQEGDDGIRLLSAAALGQLGVAANTKPLYTALRDRQPEVREAAYRALAALQGQMGIPLPAVQ